MSDDHHEREKIFVHSVLRIMSRHFIMLLSNAFFTSAFLLKTPLTLKKEFFEFLALTE